MEQNNSIRAEYPPFMSAKHLKSLGFSHSMVYRMLNNSKNYPVTVIGDRRFMRRDPFFDILESGNPAAQIAG